MPDEPQVCDNAARNCFEIELEDGSFAIAQYVRSPGKIQFTHTVVPAAHEGRGLGTLLIKAGLAAARAQGLQVIPTCPFFVAYIRNHAEEQDLIDPAYRESIPTPSVGEAKSS